MDHLDGYVWLRPPGGGREWTARPGDVEPVAADGSVGGTSPDDRLLRARVAVANARSRGEVL
ncbi:hypothetical protein BIV24_16505 [Streptomyces colonosanans]|uniref:Uncharacterized protein n=2 Tax=Streptomyces colonosanans TaxID=1428652 RepID=A0A1S2PCE4_9ACTN|nr:hypothetical protein [Streptomyces colonosanans]OIJ91272.1 hypothetical protein BIV24_16505 [Streptomyces colonosanans]